MDNMRESHVSYVNTIQDNAGQKIICRAEIVEGNSKVSELGVGITLSEASQDAKKNARISMAELQSRNGTYSNNINSPDNSSNCTDYKTKGNSPTGNAYQSSQSNQNHQANQAYQSSQNSKDRFNGGGDKPASESQIKLIKDMAAELGINPEQVAARQGVSMSGELTGSDANKLIKGLKEEKVKKSVF